MNLGRYTNIDSLEKHEVVVINKTQVEFELNQAMDEVYEFDDCREDYNDLMPIYDEYGEEYALIRFPFNKGSVDLAIEEEFCKSQACMCLIKEEVRYEQDQFVKVSDLGTILETPCDLLLAPSKEDHEYGLERLLVGHKRFVLDLSGEFDLLRDCGRDERDNFDFISTPSKPRGMEWVDGDVSLGGTLFDMGQCGVPLGSYVSPLEFNIESLLMEPIGSDVLVSGSVLDKYLWDPGAIIGYEMVIFYGVQRHKCKLFVVIVFDPGGLMWFQMHKFICYVLFMFEPGIIHDLSLNRFQQGETDAGAFPENLNRAWV